MRTGGSTLLLTNDDGIFAQGLASVAEALADLGAVYVVAPDREQNAVGHALTLHRPLRVERVADRRFAINGTPSDCVNLGILGLLPCPPNLVVSGINHGSNLGDDVTYSGTVSAAMEGTLLGVPSLAVSLVDPETGGFDEAARIVVSTGQASISYLQRKLRIGFSRAARLVDMMEADGLVSAGTGGKPREVLVDRNYFDEVDTQLR